MTAARLLAVATLILWFVPAGMSQQPPPPPDSPPPPVQQPGPGFQGNSSVSGSYTPTPPPQFAPPPGGYSPYGVPYIQSPAAGYLSGVADVTTANGQYLSQVQTARLQQTQADMAKLDLRRKMAEQQRYLRSLDPTPEEQRQTDITNAINRSRNNPPPTEIWSGAALNALLTAITRQQRGGDLGPAVPVSPDILRHINLTTGATVAGAGMLKDMRRFNWPLPLLDDSFNDLRTRVEGLSRQAAEQAASGPVDSRLQRDLQKSVNDMIATTKAKVGDLTPNDYIRSMRFLRELNDATRVLDSPNVSKYFGEQFRATGNTVAELVQGMVGRGLTFAPATSGDEPFYTALHSAMVSYDYGLRQLAAR